MGRYDPSERSGLIAVEAIFINDIGWVYRPQPIVDVGMDAMVEEVVESNPMGRFIMVQVKSGLGNVHDAQHSFTYYLTAVHYEYYMRVAMPVIFTLHVPSENRVLWVPINRRTVQVAKYRWKVNISKKSVLESSSRAALTAILDSFQTDASYSLPNDVKVRSLEELQEDVALLSQSQVPLLAMAEAQRAFAERVESVNSKWDSYVERGLAIDSPQSKLLLVEVNSALTELARAQKPKLDEFVESFTISVSALHSLVLNKETRLRFGNDLPLLREACIEMIASMDRNKPRIERLLTMIGKTPKNHKALQNGRKEAMDITSALIDELGSARALVVDVVNAIDGPPTSLANASIP
jgi:hypothetical protein